MEVMNAFTRVNTEGKASAEEYPHSFYASALYAFRTLDVPDTEVYLRAAMRDYNTKQTAQRITSVSDALAVIANVEGKESIFGSRERIQMPDETLYFNTGTDRDKALLLYTLLRQSPIAVENSTSERGLTRDGRRLTDRTCDRLVGKRREAVHLSLTL